MELDNSDVKKIILAISSNSNYNFINYTQKSLNRRLSKILVESRTSVENLCIKIKTNKDYLENIVRKITVNTTEFFRNPDLWIFLKQNIINKLKNKKEINIWHAGCSSGQELYSMMVLLSEYGLLDYVDIYGTDINTEILKKAEVGIYKHYLNETFNNNLLKVFDNNEKIKNKYFDINLKKNTISVKNNLLSRANFFVHDLVTMKNFVDVKFDIIFCRNVLIYFNLDLQNNLFRYFYKNMSKESYLIIGLQESIFGNEAKMFKKLEHQVYKKIN